MTEQEAKTKWCPYANSSAVPAERLPAGSTDVTQAHARCIGSGCMAWRWSDAESLNEPTRVHPTVLKDYWKGWSITDATPDERGFVEISPPPAKAPRGFCGLAGKP